jgi:hypothetical protein
VGVNAPVILELDQTVVVVSVASDANLELRQDWESRVRNVWTEIKLEAHLGPGQLAADGMQSHVPRRRHRDRQRRHQGPVALPGVLQARIEPEQDLTRTLGFRYSSKLLAERGQLLWDRFPTHSYLA